MKSENNGVWGDDPDGTNDIVCIRVADFDRSSNRIRTDKLTLRSVKPSERSGRLLRKGDLLLEKSGGGEQQPVGALVMYNHDFEAVCSNFVARLVVREGYDPTYLTYLHRTLYATGVNKRSIKQTTGIQNIDSSSYLSERVGIPPIEEQAAIVRYLDTADQQIRAYIGAKQKLIALLEEQRQGVIHQAVTRGLDPNVKLKPSSVEWLGDVPEHWDTVKIQDLASQIPKSFTDGDWIESPYITTDGIRLIQTGNIGVGRYLEKGYRYISERTFEELHCTEVTPNDILICRLGEPVARACAAPDLARRMITSVDVCIVKVREDLNTKFAIYSMASRQYLDWVGSLVRGSTRDRISRFMLSKFGMPFPPKNEQNQIVDNLDKVTAAIDATIDLAHRQTRLMEEYRTRLIADVVTGKLDVRKAAEALPQLEPAKTAD